jgi:hypothetical protein
MSPLLQVSLPADFLQLQFLQWQSAALMGIKCGEGHCNYSRRTPPNLLACDNSIQQIYVPSMKLFARTYPHQELPPFIQSCPFDIFYRDERNRATLYD